LKNRARADEASKPKNKNNKSKHKVRQVKTGKHAVLNITFAKTVVR